MTVLFATNDPATFGAGVTAGTNASFFDNTYVTRSIDAIIPRLAANLMRIPLEAVPTSNVLWLHFRCNQPGLDLANGEWIDFFDSSNVLIARIASINGNTVRVQAHGDTTVNGSAPSIWASGTRTFDVKIDMTSGITIELYVDGVIFSSATAANTGGKGKPKTIDITHRAFHEGFGTITFRYSEMFVTDNVSTIGMRMAELRPNTIGNYSDGGSDITNINDSNEATGIQLGTVGNKQSWNPTAYLGPASPTSIHSVVVNSKLRKGQTGPGSFAHFLRISGVDYPGSDLALTGDLKSFITTYLTNPATGVAWVSADLSSFETGVEAKA